MSESTERYPRRDCAHDAPWRMQILSTDGKTRYGYCELCRSWVQGPWPQGEGDAD